MPPSFLGAHEAFDAIGERCASLREQLRRIIVGQDEVVEQLIVAMLPLASLEAPLTAARVQALKRQGRDWFRELLLPEALAQLPPAVAPLRRNGGRLAILDGRVRSRSWGEQVLATLQPWTPLQRLLPQ